MAIFSNSELFSFAQFDLENKVYSPTQKVYDELLAKLDNSYLISKNSIIDFHHDMATASRQLYEHPVETATAWYYQAVNGTVEIFAVLNEDVIPAVKFAYQQLFLDSVSLYQTTAYSLSVLNQQTRQFMQDFKNEPLLKTSEIYTQIEIFWASLWRDLVAETTTLFNMLIDISETFLNQPGITLDALIYSTISACLNLYEQFSVSLFAQL